MSTTAYLDRILFGLLCLMVFFLPATNAFVKVAAALAIPVFLLKRALLGSEFFNSFPIKKVLIPLAFYVAWAGLSIIWSQFPLLSLKGWIGKSLYVAFLLLISHETLSSRKRFGILMTVFLVSAGIASLDGLWQAYAGHDILVCAPFSDGRVMASFKHPNDFGAYLIFVILPVIVFTILAGMRSITEYTLRNSLFLFGGIFFVGISSAALGLTYSRGAWLGMLIAAGIFMFFNRRLWPVVLGCTVLFFLIFQPLLFKIRNVSFVADSLTQSAGTQQEKVQLFNGDGRLVFWKDAIKIIHDHPVLGTGLNTYTMVIKKYVSIWAIYPHNCYLQMGAELGLVGLGLFLCFLIAVIVQVSSCIRRLPQEADRWLLAAFFAGWCGFLFHSGWDTSLYSSQLTAVFWILTGALLSFSHMNRDLTKGLH